MKVMIFSATGKMGGGMVNALKDSDHELYGLTRDASSAASQALKNKGVTVLQGDYDDRESLDKALSGGFDSVFYTIFPDLKGAGNDLKQAQNIIAAVKAAGVKQLIYGSLMYPGTEEGFKAVHESLEPTSWVKTYFDRKLELDQLVKDSGVQYWTIIRPPGFIQNVTLPETINFIYPDLPSKLQFKSCWAPDAKQWYSDGTEAGKFAAVAVNQPEKLHTKEVKFGTEALTNQEIVDKLSKASGKDIKVYDWPEDELKQALSMNPFHITCDIISKMGFAADIDKEERYGVELTPISEWLEKNKSVTWFA